MDTSKEDNTTTTDEKRRPIKKHSSLKSLGRWYIIDYGISLTSQRDSVTKELRRSRLFCADCKFYKTSLCPGWECCPFKAFAVKEIKKELRRQHIEM